MLGAEIGVPDTTPDRAHAASRVENVLGRTLTFEVDRHGDLRLTYLRHRDPEPPDADLTSRCPETAASHETQGAARSGQVEGRVSAVEQRGASYRMAGWPPPERRLG